jgi:DHA2 family multidrug resistance protein
VLTFLVVGICGVLIFVLVELLTIRNGKQPLLDIRVFTNTSFFGGTLCTVTIMFALYAGGYMLPVYLQSLRSQTAFAAGMIQLPSALVSMASSLVGGILVDKLGTKRVVIPGLIILCFGVWGLSTITLATPLVVLQMWLVIRGLSLGMTMQPIGQAALRGLKANLISQGSTINSVVRSVTSSLSVALATTLLTMQTQVHYVHLAEQVTADSPSGNYLQQLASYFQTQGMNQANAMTAAIETMYNQLQEQATLLALKDIYLLTVASGLVAIFVVLFVIRVPPKKKAVLTSKGKNGEVVKEVVSEEEESAEPAFMH